MAANNQFGATQSFSDPGVGAFAITPSDSTVFKYTTRGIYVGVSGDVTVICSDGSGPITFTAVPQGITLAVQANQVKATGTTADDLVGLY